MRQWARGNEPRSRRLTMIDGPNSLHKANSGTTERPGVHGLHVSSGPRRVTAVGGTGRSNQGSDIADALADVDAFVREVSVELDEADTDARSAVELALGVLRTPPDVQTSGPRLIQAAKRQAHAGIARDRLLHRAVITCRAIWNVASGSGSGDQLPELGRRLIDAIDLTVTAIAEGY